MRLAAAKVLRVAAAAFVIALGVSAIVAVVDERSWPAGQLAAVTVLATTERTPFLRWVVAVLSKEPRVKETVVAGAHSTVVRPGGGTRWPPMGKRTGRRSPVGSHSR